MIDVREAVVTLLSSHVPTSDAESEHARHILTSAHELGDQLADRGWFDPGHLTASAFVLHPSGGSIVLVHHAKLGRWVQPGGHLEVGDVTFEDAAKREASEETGLVDLDPLGLLDVDVHPIPARAGEPAHLHLDLRFAFQARDDRLTPGEGTTATRWVPFTEALELDPSVARPVAKLIGGSK